MMDDVYSLHSRHVSASLVTPPLERELSPFGQVPGHHNDQYITTHQYVGLINLNYRYMLCIHCIISRPTITSYHYLWN